MSTLNVSNLAGPSSTGTAATLSSINGGPIAGARNRIINGDMRISQRGTSFTTNGYTVDRWTVYNSGGTFTLTQETAASGSQPEPGMSKYLRVSRSSPSGIFYVSQKIEDVSIYDGYVVTVSFYAKANTNITLPVRLVQEFGSGGSAPVTVGTVNTSITSSWAKYTASFTLPSQSGKTIGSSSFVELVFDTPATYSTLDITGVQLEAGSVATPYERRPYSVELGLCQRYYQRIQGTGSEFRVVGSGIINATTTVARSSSPLKTSMRASPSIGINGIAAFDGSAVSAISSVINYSTSDQCSFDAASSSLTIGRPGVILIGTSAANYFDLSAEL